MISVGIIDLVSLAITLLALGLILTPPPRGLPRDVRVTLLCLLGVLLFHHFSNSLEWLGITRALDSFEDHIQLLEPFLWIFFLYALLREIAGRALRESEARSSAIFAAIPDLIFRMRRDGTYLDFRTGSEDLLVEPIDSVIGRSISERSLPPELIRTMRVHIERALETCTLQTFNYRLTVPKGEREFEARLIPCGADDVLCIARDITDRQRTERDLRDSNEVLAIRSAIAELSISSLTPGEMCDGIVEIVRGAMPCDALLVMIIDENRRHLESVGAYDVIGGELRRVEDLQIPLTEDDRILGPVIFERRPLLIHRETEEAAAAKQARFGDTERWSASLLYAPMVVGNRVFDMVSVQSYTPHTYTQRELDLLSHIALQAGPALEATLLSEQLRQSEANFRLIYENAPVMMHSVDEEGRILDVNRRWLVEMGHDRDDVIGRRVTAFMAPESCEWATREGFPNLWSLGYLRDIPLRFLKPNDAAIDVLLSADVVTDAQQRRVAVTVMDNVTDRKRAEEALRTSQAMLRTVLDTIPVRVFWKDRQSTYLGCNRRFAEDAGLRSPEEIVGKTDFELSWVEQAELYTADDREVIESGQPKINYEEPQTWPDGTSLWLRTSKIPLRDIQGKIVGMLGCYEDITEHRRAERALRESEARYRGVYETAPLAFVIWDRKCQVTGWNDRAEEMFGWTSEEVMGRNFFEFLIPPEARPRVEDVVEALLRGEVERNVVNENLTKDGRTILCEWNNAILLSEENEVIGAISLGLDITERRRAEEERRRLEAQFQHAQKLESLGVLAGGIAHDFNNLLVGILGNAGLALLELSPESPARETLVQIETAAQRAADLTRQLLAYSGKGKFLVEAINLSLVVKEMTHLLEASISKKAVLRCSFVDDLPLVEADATQVRQVVMNLITNASEALGDRSGVIAISTGVMHADRPYLEETYLNEDLEEGEYIFIEVSDTGVGMTSETLNGIFDPFFTTKFTGRGLGLAAVLGIMRGHRGAIKVKSVPGRGSTFRVLFPAAEITETTALTRDEGPLDARAWRGTGTVLVVDDEETVRAVGRRVLERAGLTVLTACDGQQAVEVFRAHRGEIDLILLDMTMPHMDGEEAFQELRRIQDDVKVILSSGYNEQEATNRFAGTGLAGFIQKPYSPAHLLETVRSLLSPQS